MNRSSHGQRRQVALAGLLAALVGLGTARPGNLHEEQIFEDAYPLEAAVCFSASLFHWVDSLAGTSGGKTIPAYRRQFERLLGSPSDKDVGMLRRFVRIRERHAAGPGTGGSPRGASAMLAVFLETPRTNEALEALEAQLSVDDLAALRAVLDHFRPRYEKIWQNGKLPLRFLQRARKDPARVEIEKLLKRAAEFFGVDPTEGPRPRLVLTPVPEGWGTHAQALGRHLLIEVRPRETLADQVAPIVHENIHFLMARIDPRRADRMASVLAEAGPSGRSALATLREALPTAIGQGVAHRRVHPRSWSLRAPWYHTEEVDRFAKAIYTVVEEALEGKGSFDEVFAREVLARYPAVSDGISPR